MSRALALRGWPTRVLVDANAILARPRLRRRGAAVRVRDAAAAAARARRQVTSRSIHGSLPAPAADDVAMRAARSSASRTRPSTMSRGRPISTAPTSCSACRSTSSTRCRTTVLTQRLRRTPLYGVGEIDRQHREADAAPRAALRVGRAQAARPRCWRSASGRCGASTARSRTRAGRDSRSASCRAWRPLKQFPALFEILAPIIAAHRPSMSKSSASPSATSRCANCATRCVRSAHAFACGDTSATSPPSIAASTTCSPACRNARRSASTSSSRPVRHAGAGGRRAAVHRDNARRRHRLSVYRSAHATDGRAFRAPAGGHRRTGRASPAWRRRRRTSILLVPRFADRVDSAMRETLVRVSKRGTGA